MKKYITQLSRYQVETLNENINYENCRLKCFSVLSYVVKHVNLNKGSFTKSFEEFHKMYSRYHWKYKMSLANFKKIIVRLTDLKLVFINKYKNKNMYSVDPKVAEKVAKNIAAESKANSKVKGKKSGTQILTSIDYTNTVDIGEIFDYYEKQYKGLTGNPTLRKSELKKIAKNLFMMRGVHEAFIQNLVFSKINYSNRGIQAAGAINYINTIITEKLVEFNNYVCC